MNKLSRFSLPIAIAFLVLAVLFFALDASARASDDGSSAIQASLIVNTLEDELNTDGDCSLREALTAANTNAPVDACLAGDAVLTDTVTFSVAGTITVTSQISVTAGGPLIVDGGEVITTSGDGTERVWWVDTGSNLTLERMTIDNGYNFEFPPTASGGVYNNQGILNITDCTFAGNYASSGGGVYNDHGTLNVIASVFITNYAVSYGGGIYSVGGALVVTQSVFLGNMADMKGSGIAVENGDLTVSQSIFSGNQVFAYSGCSQGGSINHWGAGHLSVDESTFTDNVNLAGGCGGGIGIYGYSGSGIDTTITNSSFVNNNGASYGGGIFIGGDKSDVTVANSTFSGNTSSHNGGGISLFGFAGGSVLTVVDSTFTSNHVSYYAGGGIYVSDASATIINSTIAGNFGGGTHSESGGNSSIAITNTIIANNLSGGDCSGTIIDGGHNLASDDTCSLDPANGSLPNTDPLLGPPQDNGGPTLTHALLPGSPAIDAGDDSACPDTDQRGVPRPIDGNGDGWAICDIGAVEVERLWVIPSTIALTGPTNGLLGTPYAFTATVEPISATLPLVYLWQAGEQEPITHTGGLSDTASFIWSAPGVYNMIIQASNYGEAVTTTHTITITDIPVAGLVASNDSPTLLGETTTFTAGITAGTNVLFTWDFGDGALGSGAIVTHTYTAAGAYTATITATNSAGSVVAVTQVQIDKPIHITYIPMMQRQSLPPSGVTEPGMVKSGVILPMVAHTEKSLSAPHSASISKLSTAGSGYSSSTHPLPRSPQSTSLTQATPVPCRLLAAEALFAPTAGSTASAAA